MVKQYQYMIFHLYLQIITNRSIFQKVRSSRKLRETSMRYTSDRVHNVDHFSD